MSDLIAEWYKSKEDLDAAKKRESELRKQVITEFFESKEGTQTKELGNGFKLKCSSSKSFKLTGDEKQLHTALNEMVAVSDYGLEVAKRLVTFQPKLSASEYKKLDGNPELKQFIDEFVEWDLTSPSLKVEAPKVK